MANHVDPEEMALRRNLDVIASLNMIGEGGPAPILEDEKLDKEDNAKSKKT